MAEQPDIARLRIALASPEQILAWSYGEVTKPETINYRRLRPERDGLFDEVIFGPVYDYQCYCGKYKGAKYKGIVCEKCGVEITHSRVRRERMGHITLAAPVAHPWYSRRTPSAIGLLLNLNRRQLERVLYFAQYIITALDEDARQRALEKLNQDHERRIREIEQKLRKMFGSANIAQQISNIQANIAAIEKDVEKQLNNDTEILMGLAAQIQHELESHLNQTARSPIVLDLQSLRLLPPSCHLIVEGTEVISNEHLVALNAIVKQQLDEIEAAASAAIERRVAPLKAELSQLKSKLDSASIEIAERLEAEVKALTAQYEHERELLSSLAVGNMLSESQYRELKLKFGPIFSAGMGAEALSELLRKLDLDKTAHQLWREFRATKSKARKKEILRRLRLIEALRRSKVRPEWMILTVLPVLPPDLRPMVQLDGGRFASSDLNDLYRRVINRNNRLKKLIEINAPDVIIRNEKRLLQEAVDALFDQHARTPTTANRQRQLKSLSDMLKGKKGRFRRNLLGKRVDYSGRSVIVVGPTLKLHQCGLPRVMALELFKPFVIKKLIELGIAYNLKGAKRMIEQEHPLVWGALEEVIKSRPVLLNRAPTLHRLGIQAFEPILIDGKAIQIHPLVCQAFNADFDGDQMAVHVPLSELAVAEARTLMLSTRNLLKPSDGESIVNPTKDMVLGIYYLTFSDQSPRLGDGKAFANIEEVEIAYELGHVDLHARIKLLAETYYDDDGKLTKQGRRKIVETTVGRAIFNRIVPPALRFVNQTLDKGALQSLVTRAFQLIGATEQLIAFVDAIKEIGFKYATRSGISIAHSDIIPPEERENILREADQRVMNVDRQFRRGLLTAEERDAQAIAIWSEARDKVAAAVRANLSPSSDLSMMATSGATKGGFSPIAQLAGMRGLMADPSGRIIPLPIRSNFSDGLDNIEYFISTHGQRKGLADTAMRTSDAGYLTRRLIDVAQDIIITAEDCETTDGIWICRKPEGRPMRERIIGRFAASDVVTADGRVICHRNEMIDEAVADEIEAYKVERVHVRSPLTCRLIHGLCQKCYGRDLGRGTTVAMGTAVGIIAAQSIGEPGTQLTLRTFHTGGVAVSDITQGLPRVEELFEGRRVRDDQRAIIAEITGHVEVDKAKNVLKIYETTVKHDSYDIPEGWTITVQSGDDVQEGDLIASRGRQKISAEHGGRVTRNGNTVTVSYQARAEVSYPLPPNARLLVKDGDFVSTGTQLVDGKLDPHDVLKVLGREACQEYLINEMQQVYRSQGVSIHDKHFEVIIRKMLNYVQIVSAGDSEFLPGDVVNRHALAQANERLLAEDKRLAVGMPVLLGITKAALVSSSFLSAASFQFTLRVLAQAALEGRVDDLRGLKENVIIGKLIPAGTGFTPTYEGIALPSPKLAGHALDLSALLDEQ